MFKTVCICIHILPQIRYRMLSPNMDAADFGVLGRELAVQVLLFRQRQQQLEKLANMVGVGAQVQIGDLVDILFHLECHSTLLLH